MQETNLGIAKNTVDAKTNDEQRTNKSEQKNDNARKRPQLRFDQTIGNLEPHPKYHKVQRSVSYLGKRDRNGKKIPINAEPSRMELT